MVSVYLMQFATVGALAGTAARAAVFSLSVPASQPSRQACPRCQHHILVIDEAATTFGLLKGQCSACQLQIGPPALAAEVTLAAVFSVLASRHAGFWEILAFCWLAAIGMALALIDLTTQRLPNILTLCAYSGVFGFLATQAFVDHDGARLVGALVGGVGLAGFYLALAAVTGGVGMGDVKLGASIGTALGWLGLTHVLTGTLISLLLASLAGLAAIFARRLRWHDPMPFGPFLILGTLITLATTS